MGNYAEFWIGPFYLGKTKSEADPRLVHLFRESDRNEVEGTKKELPFTERRWFDSVKDDENVTAFYYHAPVPIVRDRLNLKGYTVETAKSAVSLCLERSAQLYPAWREHFQELALATGDDWFKGLQWIRENSRPRDSAQIKPEGPTSDVIRCMRGFDWFAFPGPDLNVPLRLALEICPDSDEFVCDMTDLLLAGYADPSDELLSSGSLSLHDLNSSGKTILITEGKTDTWIISESLTLLYPHLADQFTFMDFEGARVSGGAGSLANILKAFAGAGIVNKTIAVFDNDTAAEAAIRTLRNVSLPPNIVVLKLPDLDSLRAYPTIGPSGPISMNVNGMAAGLELYLGIQALTDESGERAPVQWTGYESNLRKYQGEVLFKEEIQERFRHRLEACTSNPQLLEVTDWSGIRAVLTAIFVAFHDFDSKRIIASLDEYYSSSC